MFLYIFFLFFQIASSSANILLSPQSARIVEDNSIRFILKSSKPLSAKECILNIANKTVSVDVNSFDNVLKFKLDKNHPDIIQWISLNECEFFISNVTKFSSGRFSMTYIDKNENKDVMSTVLSVISRPIKESILTSTLGALANIDCISNSGLNPSFCDIYSPQGEKVSDKCSFSINPIQPKDVGKWLCIMGILGSIEGLAHTIILNLKEKETAVGYLTNLSSSVELKCVILNTNSIIRWCRAMKPDGTFLMLTEGNFQQRYSSLGTSIESKICSLEIKQPLDSISDFGRWRIDIGFGNNDFTGCYFTLPNQNRLKSLKNKKVATGKEKSVKIISGDSLKFDCSVTWPIKYCYIRNPNGVLVQPLSSAMHRLQHVGICQMEIKNITMEQNGKWVCGVSSENLKEDILSVTYVTVVNEELFTEQYRTKTKTGNIDYLICRSPKSNPLKYCRFVSPSGKGFNLEPGSQANSRISYFGTGLENGECGMQISDILSEDIGNWTCGTFYESSLTREKQAVFKLERSEPALAFSISMGVIGLMILGGIVIFASFKCRKREDHLSFRSGNRTPSINSEENLTYNQNFPMSTIGYNNQPENVNTVQTTANIH